MSERKEQVKPLAPAAFRLDNKDASNVSLGRGRQNCIKICGCSVAVLLIATTILLVLMFTAFHVKDPSPRINSVGAEGVGGLNGTVLVGPGRNLTMDFNVSIRNPNMASFKFGNTTTSVYYEGGLVGEAKGPPGEAPARKRLLMGLSVGLMVDRIMEMGRFKSDLEVEMFSFRSYTRINGKVKITSIIKKKIHLKMNCTMNLSIKREEIQDLICN